MPKRIRPIKGTAPTPAVQSPPGKPAAKKKAGKPAPGGPSPKVIGPRAAPVKRLARITVVETVSFEQTDGKHPQVRSAYSRLVDSTEEVYQRSLPVRTTWTPVDTGWVTAPGMIHLSNEEGKGLTVIPTREEREAIGAKVVEVKVDGADDSHVFLLRPGESMRVYPGPGLKLVARCPAGDSKCALSVYPG